jgi:hypothetical protein
VAGRSVVSQLCSTDSVPNSLLIPNERIVSKPRAAKWAVTHLPREWNELIHLALDPQKTIPLARIRQFIRFADQKSTSKSTRARRRKLPKNVPN